MIFGVAEDPERIEMVGRVSGEADRLSMRDIQAGRDTLHENIR